MAYVNKEMKKINDEHRARVSTTQEERKRIDTVRTRIVRMVKKISQIALVKLNAKGDYKSNSAIKFTEAYSKTFDMVTRALT